MKNLKREIALYYGRHYDVRLNGNDDVICTIGSKEGISHLCLALLGPGDTVLVPAPAFPIHVYAAVIAGASVLRIALDSEASFITQLASMCKALYPGPKLVMLNYPHNPTGIVASKEFFREIVTLAKKFNFMLINDFAYAKITYDGYVAPSFLEVPGAMEVGVEFGSFSKSYNMAGWRLGYCVGNKEMIGGLAKIKGYYDYGIFSAIQVAGIVAMRDCDDSITEQVAVYQKRRDVLCDGLARMGWTVNVPKAGMFLWVEIPEPYARMGSIRFSVEMMNRANVAVAPGAGFGEEGDGYLRLALVENENRIRQALKQMRRALSEIDQEIAAGTFSLEQRDSGI
jgi:alanine-synthesizing transaminase